MKHDGPHDPDHPVIDPATGEACFGCRVKGATFGIGMSATPTRNLDRKTVVRPMQEPSWEKGVAGEHRPGGGFMPYLDANGAEIGVKEFGERRRELTAIRKHQISGA